MLVFLIFAVDFIRGMKMNINPRIMWMSNNCFKYLGLFSVSVANF